jgi:hypothetical protein
MSASQSFVVDKRVTSQAVAPPSVQTVADNQVVEVPAGQFVVVRVDAGGGPRSGVILRKGVAGQVCVVVNEGGELIDVAAAATSNIAGAGGSDGWLPATSYMYVFDAVADNWSVLGNALA